MHSHEHFGFYKGIFVLLVDGRIGGKGATAVGMAFNGQKPQDPARTRAWGRPGLPR